MWDSGREGGGSIFWPFEVAQVGLHTDNSLAVVLTQKKAWGFNLFPKTIGSDRPTIILSKGQEHG